MLTCDQLTLSTTVNIASGAAFVQNYSTATVVGSGFCLGNDGGWSNTQGTIPFLYTSRRGIKQLISGAIDTHAVGDICNLYLYGHHDGGLYAQSDEGAGAAGFHILENDGWFHGVVAKTTGRGDRHPTLAFTSGNAWTTDGCILLNISKGTLAGSLNGPSQPLSLTTESASFQTYLNQLPVTGVTLPLSTAIGVGPKTGIPYQATTRDKTFSVTLLVQLAQINGAYPPFAAGDYVTVAGINRVEQSMITAVTAPDANGFQTVTFAVANPNAQFILFRGGIAGQYISADANPYRSAYYALGSLDGINMIYARMVSGGVANRFLPQQGCEAWQPTGPNSGCHLYPGAEVVRNNSMGFDCVLEANPVNWTAGDLVECPHWSNGGGSTLLLRRVQHSPCDSGSGMTGIDIMLEGEGIGGGNTHGLRIHNGNGEYPSPSSPSPYSGSGGPISGPYGITILGTFSNTIYQAKAPDTGWLWMVQNNNDAKSDITGLLNLDWSPEGGLSFITSKGLWAYSGSIDAQNGFYSNHVPGWSGTYPTADGRTVTVSGGLITKCE